jgi:ribosomal protein L31
MVVREPIVYNISREKQDRVKIVQSRSTRTIDEHAVRIDDDKFPAFTGTMESMTSNRN